MALALPDDLAARIRRLASRTDRTLLGITGAPGAGKSTLARAVIEVCGPELAALVPMDGFHLPNAELHRLRRADRKGAPDTFDVAAFVALLRRLRARDEAVVFAPDFDRDLEEPVSEALPIRREATLVVTEGNYLLTAVGAWAEVRPLLDEVWFVELDEATRLDRLIARHVRHGKTLPAATAWASGPDQVNAELIARDRDRADRIVRLDAS